MWIPSAKIRSERARNDGTQMLLRETQKLGGLLSRLWLDQVSPLVNLRSSNRAFRAWRQLYSIISSYRYKVTYAVLRKSVAAG